jgi:hypothetical protein
MMLKPRNEDATWIANRVLAGSIKLNATINGFRKAALLGLPHSKDGLHAQHLDFCNREIEHFYLGPPEEVDTAKISLAHSLTESVLEAATYSIDAASLVFAHSMLDGAAADLLTACAYCDPERFAKYYAEKKITIKDAMTTRSLEEMAWAQMDLSLRHAARNDSLMDKVKTIQDATTPPYDANMMGGFIPDIEVLRTLDKRRIAIVHGDGLFEALPDIEDNILYLHKTALYLVFKVLAKYSLKLNPAAMAPLLSKPTDMGKLTS